MNQELGLFKPVVSETAVGDRLILDAKLLALLEDDISAESPLIIEIIAADGSSSYGIVWEFTADEGMVGVSAEKMGQFNCELDQFRLRHVELEKGTFAQLTFISDIDYVQDYRSLLEATLRQKYATLVKNETLTVLLEKAKSRKEIKFLVSDLKPKDAVLCINTDIEVDIVSPVGVGLDRVKSHSRVKLNWVGDTASVTNGKIDNFMNLEVQADKEKPFYKLLINVKDGEDFDVFVSSLYEYPDIMHHDYYNLDFGNSVLEFCLENVPYNILYIGLTANTEIKEFDLTLMRSNVQFSKEIVGNTEPFSQNMEGKLQCNNCMSWIPQTTMVMHSAFCHRNNVLCKLCSQVFKRSDFDNHWHCSMPDCDYMGDIRAKDKHHKTIHIPLCCDCGSYYFLADISSHRKTDCPERKIICRFCHLLVRAGPKSIIAKDLYLGTGLSEHESVCGSRTITCINCKKPVQLKEIQIHAKLHSLAEATKNLPLICNNVTCSNTIDSQSNHFANLCGACFEILSDSNQNGIPQKIIETYHYQLTVGCQQPFCKNDKCFTGRKNSFPEAEQMDPTDAALEAIRIYRLSQGSNREFYFCVTSEKIHNRRILANKLVEMGYKLPLCIKGLELNDDDWDETMTWLLSTTNVGADG